VKIKLSSSNGILMTIMKLFSGSLFPSGIRRFVLNRFILMCLIF
jgi:hypothetical protein